MKPSITTFAVVLFAASSAFAEPPETNGNKRQEQPSAGGLKIVQLTSPNGSASPAASSQTKQSDATYQQRAGATKEHSNGATSKSWVNAGLKEDSNLEAGFFTGNENKKGKQVGRQRDEKWFLGVRGSARAGAAADAGVSQTGKVGNVDVTSYAEAEAFVGTEVGAQAGVSNTGAGVNAGAFAGARVSSKVGTKVGPVDGAVKGEAWAGVGAEAGADVTFKNGKVGLDYGAGAAVGVGGKVGGEVSVDVSKPAKKVAKAGKQVAGGAKETAQSAGKSVDKAGKSVDKTAKKAGSSAKKAVRKVFK